MKSISVFFKSFIYLLPLTFLLFVTACSNSSSGDEELKEVTESPAITLEITENPVITVVSYNQTAKLTCKAESSSDQISYQWYKCSDITGSDPQPITGATSENYESPAFTEKEIRYYYCLAKSATVEEKSAIAAVAYTGLPIVYIDTPENSEITSKEDWLTDTSLRILGAEEESWNITEAVTTSIRGRGNSTWGQPKKPYALKLDKKQSILGMPKHKRWVLMANYLDNSFMRNEMAFYLSRTFELEYTVRGEFVELFLNGDYKGLYWFGEAIKPDENRVDINDGSKNISDDEDKDYLIEMDVYYDEPVRFKSSIRNMPYMIKNDDYMIDDDGIITSGGQKRLNRLQEKITDVENLLYPDYIEGMNTRDCSAPDNKYQEIIDVDSWAKFWLVNEIIDNGELGHPKSCYFTYDSAHNIFKAGPVWDFDWAALGVATYCRLESTIYYDALFKSDTFRTRLKEIWHQYQNNIHLVSEIQSLRNKLELSAELDSFLWGVNHNPQTLVLPDFNGHVDFLRNVLTIKLDVINEEINQL